MSTTAPTEVINCDKEDLERLWKIATSGGEAEDVRCAALDRHVELAIRLRRVVDRTSLWKKLDDLRRISPPLLQQVVAEWQRELPNPMKTKGGRRGIPKAAIRTLGVRLRGRPKQVAVRGGEPGLAESELSRWFAGIRD